MREIDLDQVRTRLASLPDGGRVYWRSLDELADTEEFRRMLYREFPEHASEADSSVSRRNFLKVMGASLALAGLNAGCYQQPQEQIVPYVEQPEQIVPGKPLYYATAFPFNGYGIGALVESHMGRPTKIEGNPDHPASMGASNVFMQASVLGLYDPDRSQVVTRAGQVSTWQSLVATLQQELEKLDGARGHGLRLLTGPITSPTLLAEIQALLDRYPEARWHVHEPVGRDNATRGAIGAFGQAADTIYDFEQADVIVSLESNFLIDDPGSLRYARQFAKRRRVSRKTDGGTAGEVRLNRLFVAEAPLTITGAMADSRLPVRSSRIRALAYAIARGVGVRLPNVPEEALSNEESKWAAAAAEALLGARGACVVVAGESQPPDVHVLAHAINKVLASVGKTVWYIEPVAPVPQDSQSLATLVADMNAGAVTTLLMIDTNPVYTAPADLKFEQAVMQVPLRISMGLYDDETAFVCHWHVPMAHYLESWGDIRAFDGLVSIIQPLIMPLYQSRTAYELLSVMLGEPDRSAHDLVRAFWMNRLGQNGFEATWRESLHQGFIGGQTIARKDVILREAFTTALGSRVATTSPSTQASNAIEIDFVPDPTVWDGRYANNAWLQETPKPFTKLTWDNAACMSAATARRLGVSTGEIIDVGIKLPAMIVPGHADDCISVSLGYGRTKPSLRVAAKTGFNAYAIRRSDSPWTITNHPVSRTSETYVLATTQAHFNMEGRDLVRTVSTEELHGKHEAGHDQHGGGAHRETFAGRTLPLSILPGNMPSDPPYTGNYAWGMSIDLSSCIGCNACVVACVAENNIPMVGKSGVERSREMHWIRIDTYYSAEPEQRVDQLTNPQVFFQPLPCMHCEKAPCELVCPVAATTHSDEGLNEMTYNRCIGTRYCSNNCPYKVRRFNFFEYNPLDMPDTLKMQKNPDVTVRSRGVMEKCTYCVQRINTARIDSRREDRKIRDGEVVPACAQSCPTQAIVFGDIADEKTEVHALKFGQPFSRLDYSLLNETLGTRPRTSYLAKIVERK